MIPDFKTFISESAWGDMMRRGSGESIRTEDDINLLDKEGLYEYILSHYELTDNRYELTYGTANMCIPISRKGEEILLTYDFDEVHCYFNLNVYPRLYSLLQKKFNVEDKPDDIVTEHYIISPKDECTNQFYIDVIDCIIENRNTIVRKKVNESAWGDMMRRGAGETVRKEDEFNEICEFIKNTYNVVFVGMDGIEFKDYHIHIPIYNVLGLNAFSSVEIYKNEIIFASIEPNRYHTQTLRKFITHIKNDLNQLFDKIKDTYSPEISTFDGLEHWIEFEIVPKDGKITKQFCEEVIDFILNNSPNNNHKILKILEKK